MRETRGDLGIDGKKDYEGEKEREAEEKKIMQGTEQKIVREIERDERERARAMKRKEEMREA